MTLRKKILTALFLLFIHPFSITTSGAGISANYTYALLPLFLASIGRLRRPDIRTLHQIVPIMAMYVFIFAIAAVYQIPYFEFLDRRFASFVIFMSIFSYMFISYDSEMNDSFKLAVVLISVYFSIRAIFRYTMFGGADLGFAAKDLVGSQRFGFVYVLAIWLMLQEQFSRRKVLNWLAILIISTGLILTFSRSGVVSIIGSLGIFMAYNLIKWLKRPKFKGIARGVMACFLIMAVVLVLHKKVPEVFYFFDQRFFAYFKEGGETVLDMEDQDASEGYRVFMTNTVMDFTLANPFTGSGFLGVWILFSDLQGSAHSQYLDVLFRTGFLGFLAYLFMIYKMLRYLNIREPGMFWGVVGILIYGFFHETFKDSQGGFILTFLLGMTFSKHKTENVLPKIPTTAIDSVAKNNSG